MLVASDVPRTVQLSVANDNLMTDRSVACDEINCCHFFSATTATDYKSRYICATQSRNISSALLCDKQVRSLIAELPHDDRAVVHR